MLCLIGNKSSKNNEDFPVKNIKIIMDVVRW